MKRLTYTLLFLLAGLTGIAQEKKVIEGTGLSSNNLGSGFQFDPENGLIRFIIDGKFTDWYRLTKPEVQPQDTAGMPEPCKEAIRLRAVYGNNLDAHYALPEDTSTDEDSGASMTISVFRPVRGVIESLERQCAEAKKGGRK